MRALAAALVLLAACTSAPEPYDCPSAAVCTATAICVARPDIDGGTFCTETEGRACAGEADCASVFRCRDGKCRPPDATKVPCDATHVPRTGDACDPVPSGYVCLYPSFGSCSQGGTQCDCVSGRWRCAGVARDWLGDGGPPPCGTAPLCWTWCGIPPS